MDTMDNAVMNFKVAFVSYIYCHPQDDDPITKARKEARNAWKELSKHTSYETHKKTDR